MAVAMGNIQTKAKPQENNEVVNEVSNNQPQKKHLSGKAEEPNYSDKSVEAKRTQPSNYYENKTENHYSRTLKKKTV